MDRLDEQLRSGVLEEEPLGACSQSTRDVGVGVEGRDDDHGERVLDVGSGEDAGGLYAVEVRHPDVEEAHVGA
jgi:hypothetical protein